MMDFLVTADGGLTTAGYVTSIAAMVILVVIAAVLFHKKSSSGKLTTQQLVTCAVALALAYATSYLKVFSLPFGGSVTLCSMLFIVLIGYWYGPKIGILTGLVYGIFQFLQEPYVLSFFQVCCDYILAFGAMGIAGFFSKSNKYGLQKAYVAAILARGVFHVLGGYLYWMSYMPENYPKSLSAIYPIVYNYSYILAEGVITLILISIPAVSKALVQVRKMVTVPGEQNA
ncbi:energy-coupled thiamine transporter ThiT [Blautia ammoniilytica]|uniref:Energy-coupled thiamine transporter ThiT n=1 Tax=Blautia ammoniilytica TaxID=2981782 RepID=A0ABT2TPW0_9FIRM|nr:energy-coupled thiamine transporter ThiT [Blautia ammoniilytica]MCU6764248.1 energy-coupled thiamine transporter ThiT [Blautia ammoniilytica]